jgi:hypothetical protein
VIDKSRQWKPPWLQVVYLCRYGHTSPHLHSRLLASYPFIPSSRCPSLKQLVNMLRLRPSELTLTPDDVDETFRRIALRQTSRPRTTLPVRPTGQPGRPILRRGAQRSTRDAITALGSISILQPQQATFSSVDEEAEHASSQDATQSTEQDDAEASASSSRGTEPEPPHSPASPTWSLPSPVSPPRRTMHLPFRFGRSRRTSTTQSPPDAVVAVARTPTRAPYRHARLGSTGTSSIGDTSNNSTLSPSGGSTESTPGLRGGGDRVRDIAQDTPHAPSPLQQMQRLSSPAYQQPSGDPTKSPTSPRVHEPTLYLEGYFHNTQDSTKYRLRESNKYRFWDMAPHSEPRRGSDRQPSAARSSSTGAGPGSRLPSAAGLQSGQFSDDVFRTLPAVEPLDRLLDQSSTVTHGQDHHSTTSDIFHSSGGSLQPEQPSARTRHFSSDASAASAQFSYYGSLASSTRFPSSEASLLLDVSRVQLDGTAASNESHRSSTSGNPFVGTNAAFRPTSGSSVHSWPSMVGSGLHGLSPLPSMPYNRNQASLPVPFDPTHGYVDAATAVVRGLESPLDPYAQHYQQQQLRAQAARQEAFQQQAIQRAIAEHHNAFQSRTYSFQTRRPSHGQGSQPHPPPQFANVPRLPVPRQSQQPDTSPTSQFGGLGRRSEQRSGESNPVAPSVSQAQMALNGRVQAQRAAYERLHNPRAMQVETDMNSFRRSLPQTTVPYDRSNQPRDYTPPQFPAMVMPRRDEERSSSPFIPQSHPRPQAQPQLVTYSSSPNAPSRLPIRQPSRQRSNELPQRAPTQSYRPLPGARHLHPSRDSPLTALALDQGSGTTSRRSRSPLIRARTHRRIPPEQRDQENDGDRSLMRREEENVNIRYGDEEQSRGRMDETPPRIGRVERRMLE